MSVPFFFFFFVMVSGIVSARTRNYMYLPISIRVAAAYIFNERAAAAPGNKEKNINQIISFSSTAAVSIRQGIFFFFFNNRCLSRPPSSAFFFPFLIKEPFILFRVPPYIQPQR